MNKIACTKANQNSGEFVLPNLPYGHKDLEPHYSEKLINLHHGKHHQAYVTNLNNMIKGSPYDNMSLEEIIKSSVKDSANPGFFNNSAQIWNHSFFWHCMKPSGGGAAKGEISVKILEDFSSYDKFKEEFSTKATKVFGSGWCWLVVDSSNKLKITTTSNAACPLTDGLKPVLTIDVWEHAYYPDYENRRPEFITKFLDHLVNWDFVNQVFTGKCSDL